MNIYYQGEKWAYSHETSEAIKNYINIEWNTTIWLSDFLSVWKKISDWWVWVLPVENSYAGSIHENLYNFLRFDYEIIWEYDLAVNHYLLSNEESISDIKKVYSHPQALSQCHNYLEKNNIIWEKFSDTAWAAKYISENDTKNSWAIASKLAAEIYNLNIIDQDIVDQNWNTTKFFIIAKKWSNIKYKNKQEKVSIIFETKNIPASLYKCLWAFATNNVNLTKIESMPSLKDPFTYMFFMTFEWKPENENIKKTLEELEFFTNYIKILGEY